MLDYFYRDTFDLLQSMEVSQIKQQPSPGRNSQHLPSKCYAFGCSADNSTRLSSRPDILTRVLDPDTELLNTSVPLAQTLVHGLDTSLVEDLGLHP
jgi:hypothetical protein